MVRSNRDIRVKPDIFEIIWNGFWIVSFVIIAFMVALPMGLAMVGTILLMLKK